MPSARSADGQMVLGQLLPHLSDALMGMPEPHALFRCAEVLESIFQRIKFPFCPMTKPTEGALSAKDGTSSERVQTDAESADSEALSSSKAVSQSDHEDAWSDFWAGARSTLPIMIGILPLGFILGTQGAQHGLSAIGMAIMCAFNFAGGSEFAAVALWSSAPSFIVIVCATWLINCRHIVLGAALTPFMQSAKVSTPRSLLAFFVMCDETWALSMQEVHRRRKAGRPAAELFSFSYHMGVGVTLWTSWFMVAAIGAAVGGSLGDLTRWGFLMAFPATFIGLVAAMRPALSKSGSMAASALVAAGSSLFVPLHWSILLGTITGLVLAAVSE